MAVAEFSIRPEQVLDTDICPVLPEGVTDSVELPPGQVLIAGVPTIPIVRPPRINRTDWEFTITMEYLVTHRWDWEALQALSTEHVTADLHCAAGWSVLDTHWTGVPVQWVFAAVRTIARYALSHSSGGCSTPRPRWSPAGSPNHEIADLVVFLASDRAGNLIGADVNIDGGLITTT